MNDFPSLFLALVALAYWGRVGLMSFRIRRRTRTLAGVVPVQPLERALWLFFVPVVIAWIAIPWLAASREAGVWSIPPPLRSGPWLVVRFAAALAALALFALTVRCWNRMGRHWKMAVTPGERQVLITDGPFARVRHPIYGYQILLMLASLVAVPTTPMLIVAMVHLALMIIKAHNEERHLLGTHGDDYARYIARTGRFFPRLSR
ncbi:MAG TPA: isoprenylcysteine carboxylmethyltransferase family protein [Casimicrobiaceae bacterium]|nr:isoprenylcysteine carboxylmethyltransferase family protein [Casimicrobiaceae bacterium]